MNDKCEICLRMKELLRHPFLIVFGIHPNDERWPAFDEMMKSPDLLAQLHQLNAQHAIEENIDISQEHLFH